jgi:hypothetical protein
MRGMLLGLAVMVLGGVARGDVVGIATPFTTKTGSVAIGTTQGAGRTVSYLPTEPGTYGTFFVEIRHTIAGGTLTSLSLGFQTSSSGQGAQTASGTMSGFTLNQNAYGVASFDLSSMTFLGANSSLEFWVTGVTSTGSAISASDIQWAVDSGLNSSSYSGAWASSAPTNVDKGLFEIKYTPVPEPGTLLLGGIAAACGGGGVWWRRKRKPQVAESVETVTAV